MDPSVLLQQLRDVHSPTPVDWWPLAPGWWAIIALVCMLFALGIYRYWRGRHARATRRASLQALSKQQEQYQHDASPEALNELVKLLKRAIASAQQDPGSLSLTGDAWRTCLQTHFNLDAHTLALLTQGHYQAHCPILTDKAFVELKKGLRRLQYV